MEATEEELRNLFARCGPIITIRLPTHKDTGKKTGYGFIDFKFPRSIQKAKKWIELNLMEEKF